jgi:hypothetical protein
MFCSACGYPAPERTTTAIQLACPECGCTEPLVEAPPLRRKWKWLTRLIAAAVTAGPIVALGGTMSWEAIRTGSANGWAVVGLSMIGLPVALGTALVVLGIGGLMARAYSGGRMGFGMVGQGVLIGLAIDVVAVLPLMFVSKGGC